MFRLHLDVDIKSDSNTTPEEEVLQLVLPGIREVVEELFPESPSPTLITGVSSHFTLLSKPDIIWKFGYHLVWPQIHVTKQQHNRFILTVGERFRSRYGEGIHDTKQVGPKERETKEKEKEERETKETAKGNENEKEKVEEQNTIETAEENVNKKEEGMVLPDFFTTCNTWAEIFDTSCVSHERADMRFVI